MSEKRISATARVQVVVEVEAGSWGSDCPMDQVFNQAKQEGIAKIERYLQKEGNGRVIAATVVAVLVEEKR